MKFHLSLFLSVCLLSTAFGQPEQLPAVIPSPNATAFGLFGEVPVSNYSGIPQIGVPLFTINGDDLQIPMEMAHNASGFRPDVHPSWVGLNWSLNVGGAITRVVRNIPDEYNESQPIPNGGFNPRKDIGFYYTYAHLQGSGWSNPVNQSIADGIGIDREPDIFTFNFLGITGKFFLDENRQWRVQSDRPLKVSFTDGDWQTPFIAKNYASQYSHKTFKSFTITDDKGIQYLFGTENAIEYSVPMYVDNNDLSCRAIASSWFLVKITPPAGRPVIFNYERGPFQSVFNYTQAESACYISATHNAWWNRVFSKAQHDVEGGLSIGIVGSIISPVYLTSIENPAENCVIRFITSKSNELAYTPIASFHGPLPGESSPYWNVMRSTTGQLTTPYIVPSNPLGTMLSMTLDIPYFTRNPAEVPNDGHDFATSQYVWLKLDEIDINYLNTYLSSDYPGGPEITNKKIRFHYYENANARLKLSSFDISSPDGTNSQAYTFSYFSGATEQNYLYEISDHWGFSNNYKLHTPDGISYNWLNDLEHQREPDFLPELTGVLKTIQFPTGGRNTFYYELNSYDDIFLNSSPGYAIPSQGLLLHQSGIAGGLRIKKIETNDGLGHTTAKEYHYSGGVLEGKPKYSYNYVIDGGNGQRNSYCSSVIPLTSSSKGQHISYGFVDEMYSDGSKISYKYTSRSTGFGDDPAVSLYHPDAMTYFPTNSLDMERGQLLEKHIYDASGKQLSFENTTYQRIGYGGTNAIRGVRFDNAMCVDLGSDWSGFASMAAYYDYLHYFKPLKITKIDYFDQTISQTSETTFTYNSLGLPVTITSTASDNTPIQHRLKYPSDYSGNTVYDGMVSKNMLSTIVENEKWRAGQFVDGYRYNYASFNTTPIVKLATIQYASGSNTNYQLKQSYQAYDDFGHVLQSQKANDNLHSYLWAYGSSRLVADITGASYTQASSLITPAVLNSPGSNTQILGQLAALRAGLGALVTAATYSLSGAVLKRSTPDNKTETFEYDNLDRVIVIKNNDGNILKQFAYAMNTKPYNQNVFYSDDIMTTISRSNCGTCFFSTDVPFEQPGGKFMSLTSQNDAQQQALNDIQTNENSYAIANGAVCAPATSSYLTQASPFEIFGGLFLQAGSTVSVNDLTVLALTPISSWTNSFLTIGTLSCPAGKPSVTRVVSTTETIRNWQIQISPSGVVGIKLISGTPPPNNTTVTFKFDYPM